MTRTTWTWILAPGLLFLGACGIGTAAAAGGGGGSSSGGGDPGGGPGSTNEPPSVAKVLFYSGQTSPAVLQFDLLDPESDAVTVEVRVRIQGAAAVPATLLAGPVSSSSCQPQTATDAAGLVDMATGPTGVRYFLLWDFAADGLGPGLETVASTLEIEIVSGGGTAATPGNPPPLNVLVGNDAPVIAPLSISGTELAGNAAVPVVVTDTSQDQVRVSIEYLILGDPACTAWQLARPVGLPAGTPTPPFQLTIAKADGSPVNFQWDTDFAISTPTMGCDLVGEETLVDVRYTVEEILAHCEDVASPLVDRSTASPVLVDNNAPPAGTLDDGLFMTNPDARRGVPVPYRVLDPEGDDVRVLLQWARPGQAFPPLPATAAELNDLLDDPDKQAERELAQVATRVPGGTVGRVGGQAGLGANQARLPELALGSAALLAQTMPERPLQILRAASRPGVPGWSSNPLSAPVDCLPLHDGTTALVLDDLGGNWSLLEVTLANGVAVPSVIGPGTGTPHALDLDPGGTALLVAVGPELRSYSFPDGALLWSRNHNFTSGPHAVAALGPEQVLATGDDKLVRFDLAAGTSAELLSSPDEPWGLVLDPLRPGSVLLGLRADDRVVSFDLEARTLRTLEALVAPADVGALGAVAFPGPRGLALERDGARLLVACEQGGGSVRALDLRSPFDLDGAGAADPFVFELRKFGEADVGLAAGPDGLRVVSLPMAGTLAVGGGVLQVRQIVPPQGSPGDPLAYDPLTQVVEVTQPFDPALSVGDRWRLGPPRTSPTTVGATDVFLWDTRDVRGGGDVRLKLVPFDGDVGSEDVGTSLKDLRANLEVQPVELVDAALQGPADVRPADLDGDGDLDLVSVNPLSDNVTAFLQTAPRTFELAPSGPVSDPSAASPSGFDLADLDGDGVLDLVTANLLSDNLTLFLGDGMGGFAIDPGGPLVDGALSGPGPVAVRAADLDADGDLDLVAANSVTGNLSLFFQNPPGVFTAGPPLSDASTLGPRGVAAADLDGDGDTDLVSVNFAGDSLTIFFQTTPGGFTVDPLGALGLGPGATGDPLDVVLADLDGDGDVDIASADSATDSVSLFFQQSPGDFHGPSNTSVKNVVNLEGASGIDALDVDRDGALDLVVSGSQAGRIAVLFQSSPGQFELSAGGAIAVPGASLLSSVAAGDLDGDGDADLVVADADGGSSSIQIAYLDSPGAFVVPGNGVLIDSAIVASFSAQAADLDADGDVDLAISLGNMAPTPGILPLLRGPNGSYSFGAVLPNAGGDGVSYLNAADLDGDGDTDLVGGFDGPSADELVVFLQDPAGVFTPAGSLTHPSLSSPVLAVGDLDGDGDVDLVTANSPPMPAPGDLLIFFQTSPGQFVVDPINGPLADPALNSPTGVVAADLDGDGDLDLASSNAGSSNVTVFLQGAAGTFTLAPAGPISNPSMANPSAIAAGDLDGDGDLDLVTANRVTDNVTVFLQTAPATFSLAPGGALDAPGVRVPASIQVADLDADGDLDLAVASAGSMSMAVPSNVTLFLQVGPGRFAPAPGGPLENASVVMPSVVVPVDLDGDGELDLVTVNTGTDTLTLFYGGR